MELFAFQSQSGSLSQKHVWVRHLPISWSPYVYCRAQANAESILALYEKEAEAYEDVIHSQGLQLSTKGFLSYIGIRTISSAVNDVYVGMKGPAKTSYVENWKYLSILIW